MGKSHLSLMYKLPVAYRKTSVANSIASRSRAKSEPVKPNGLVSSQSFNVSAYLLSWVHPPTNEQERYSVPFRSNCFLFLGGRHKMEGGIRCCRLALHQTSFSTTPQQAQKHTESLPPLKCFMSLSPPRGVPHRQTLS